MPTRDNELLRRLKLLQRLTKAATEAMHDTAGDPLQDELAKLTPDERAILDKMRSEWTPRE